MKEVRNLLPHFRNGLFALEMIFSILKKIIVRNEKIRVKVVFFVCHDFALVGLILLYVYTVVTKFVDC